MIWDAEKSRDLGSASWSPWEAGGQMQFKPRGLRTREAEGPSPSSGPKVQEPGALVSKGWRRQMSHSGKRANPPFLRLFILIRSSVDWMMPARH